MKYRMIRHCNKNRSTPDKQVRVDQNGNMSIKAGVLGLCMVVTVLIGLKVLVTARIATIGDSIRTLEEEKYQLTNEIQSLESAIARSSALSVVETRAIEELGMVRARDNRLFIKPILERHLAQQ